MRLLGAADESDGGEAVAPVVEGVVGGFDDLWMVGEAEVVIRAHIEDFAFVRGDADVCVLGRGEDALGFPEAGGADFGEVGDEVWFEGCVHGSWSFRVWIRGVGGCLDFARTGSERMTARVLNLVGRGLSFGPGEDDFAAISCEHGVEAFLEVLEREAVGDDGVEVEAALEHDGHFVPGFVHFAAVDASNGDHIEDDCVPVDGHFAVGRDAEHGDFASVADVGEHFAEGCGRAGHFEADIEAFAHAELFLDFGDGSLSGVDGDGGAHFFGEGESVGVEVGDGDVASAGVFDDGGGHDADGPGACDEDIFAEDVELERGVDGVSEGVEDGLDIAGDFGVVDPDV